VSHLYAQSPTTPSSMTAADLTPLTHCALDCRVAQTTSSLGACHETESLWVGLKSSLAKLSNRDCSIPIGMSMVQPSTVDRDLGVHTNRELTTKQHISKVSEYVVLLSPTSSSPDLSARWLRSGDSSRPGSRNVEIRLLQLDASRSATNDDCSTAKRPERRCSPDFRAGHTRARQGKPSLVALAAGPLVGLVQTVLSRALNLLWKVPALSIHHHESRRSRSYSSRSPIFVDRFLTATATYQVWRARLRVRRPVYVKRSTRVLCNTLFHFGV